MTIPAFPIGRPFVVVVDDDAAVRSSLKFAIEMLGFAVTTCSSGEDLLDLDLPPTGGCVVIDERLPGASGLETLRELRRRGVDLPIALITSHPRPALRAAARDARVPIIEKPLLGDGLVSWIRSSLEA